MFVRLPRIIRFYNLSYSPVLQAATLEGVASIATDIIYALLPLIITLIYNEIWAGILIGIGNLIMFLLLPIAGELSNKFGSVRVMRWSIISFLFSGLILITIGLTPIGLLLFLISTFVGYGLNSTQTYILQVAPKKAGGFLFGIAESIIAIGTLIATFLIPWFEQQSLVYAGILLIFLMIIRYIGTYFLIIPKIIVKKEKILSKDLFNLPHHIKKGLHFIRFNKFYPLFHLITMLFEGVFYASVWFLFPLFIVSAAESSFGGLSLGIYEIITIFFGGFFGWFADKYKWKKLYIVGWILIIFGVILFSINYSNILFLIVVGGAIIGIGNNMIFGSSSHILEKTDNDHVEDGSFVALQKIVTGLGYIIMPIVIGYFVYNFGIFSGLKVLTIIVVIMGIFGIGFALNKKQ